LRRLTFRAYSRRAHPDDPVHLEHKSTRRVYATMIEIAKKHHWEGFLGSVDEKTVWTAHWYVAGDPTDGGKACVPTLKVWQQDLMVLEAELNVDKSLAL